MDDRNYWFAAKRYGWGWGLPLTWQGWTVVAAYLLVVVGPLAFVGVAPEWVVGSATLVGVVVGTPLLLLVCLRKGEPTRWRWGSRDD